MSRSSSSTPSSEPLACVYRSGCETPNDCREHGYCRSPKNAGPQVPDSARTGAASGGSQEQVVSAAVLALNPVGSAPGKDSCSATSDESFAQSKVLIESMCESAIGLSPGWSRANAEWLRDAAISSLPVDAEPPQPSLYGRRREETLQLAREVLRCAIPDGEGRQGILWAKRFAQALLSEEVPEKFKTLDAIPHFKWFQTGMFSSPSGEFVQMRDVLAWLIANAPFAPPKKLWLWKNFVDGRPEYWAFDNPYPTHGGGDPMTLGEPCGYAIFKESTVGRTDVSEAEVGAAIKRAKPSAIAPRSMDSAPKDKNGCLAYSPSFYQGKGGWVAAVWMENGCASAWHSNPGGWRFEPTHWLPFPEKP